LSQQVQVVRLVQNTVIIGGIGLVLLLAVIVSLVTRWVVVPIRQRAQAASRVSAGNLDERMAARGTDDLAALAHSFNEMAASLQVKLRELEELSCVQRQFVSDGWHELRTPLTSDRVAVGVAVRDHGVGFGPGEHQFVFDRFWRADPARARTTGGSGLGLAIALEDTRRHSGWLQAWGERGRGSVFRLTLPRLVGGQL